MDLVLTSSLFLHLSVTVSVVDPTPEDPLMSVILVSLLPLLGTVVVVAGMFYWYQVHRRRQLSQEWENKLKLRKPKASGLDCSDACAIMDDDGSDSSSTHANNLNHNTEPLPIDLDRLVRNTTGTEELSSVFHMHSNHVYYIPVG